MKEDFNEALKERIPRPFVFGPIEFRELDREENQYNGEQWRAQVVEQLLQKSLLFGFPLEELCIHGLQVTVKGKTLKRATTIVKHSRFMRNMRVAPNQPPVLVAVQQEATPATEEEAPAEE